MDGCVGCRDKAEESIVKGCLFTHRIAGQPNLHLNNDHTVAQNHSLPRIHIASCSCLGASCCISLSPNDVVLVDLPKERKKGYRWRRE